MAATMDNGLAQQVHGRSTVYGTFAWDTLREAIKNMFTHWGKESLLALIAAIAQLIAFIIDSSTLISMWATIVAVLIILCDAGAGWIISIASPNTPLGKFDYKKSVGWLFKLAIYTYFGLGVFFFGSLADVAVFGDGMHFGVAYSLAALASVHIAVIECVELVQKVNIARQMKLNPIVEVVKKLGTFLLEAVTFALPVGKKKTDGTPEEEDTASDGTDQSRSERQ